MPKPRIITASLAPDDEGNPCRVELRPLTSRDEDLAYDAVGFEGLPKGSQGLKLLREQIRVCLVSKNGTPLTYNDTERFDDLFTFKQQHQLRELVNIINTPSEVERGDFMRSIETSTMEK